MNQKMIGQFTRPLTAILLAAALVFAGCGGEESNNGVGGNNPNNDTGMADTGMTDTGMTDTGDEDTGMMDTGDEDTGTMDTGDDCTETNGGVEICDGEDNDCDGDTDEDAEDATTYYPDEDGDGFGDEANAVEACEQPADTITDGGDCDDSDAAINPDADEVCDGVDNNCDDDTDSTGVVAQDCSNQDGVCSGTQTATCSGGTYASCGASDYGPDYIDADNESWTCDGLDNDCDGTADEVCCGTAGNNAEPPAVKIGDGGDYEFANFGPFKPTAVDATSGAPSGATSLVVWAESRSSIAAQHIDENGETVGSKYTNSVSDGTAVTVVATPQGYDLIWGETREASGNQKNTGLFVQPLTASLSENGSDVRLLNETEAGKELTSITAAYSDRGVIVGRTSVTLGPLVGGLLYRIDDRANSIQTLNLGTGGLFGTIFMKAISTDSGLLLTWFTSGGVGGDPSLQGKLYSPTGVASGSFDVSYPDQDDGQYDLFQTSSDEIMVVFPEARGSNNALVAATINLSSGTKVNKVDLTTSGANHISPSIVGRDTDGDGFPDATTVLWVIESTTGTTLVGSNFDAQNPGSLASTGNIIHPNTNDLDNTDIVATGPGAVAVWQSRINQDVQSATLSYQGPGICN